MDNLSIFLGQKSIDIDTGDGTIIPETRTILQVAKKLPDPNKYQEIVKVVGLNLKQFQEAVRAQRDKLIKHDISENTIQTIQVGYRVSNRNRGELTIADFTEDHLPYLDAILEELAVPA